MEWQKADNKHPRMGLNNKLCIKPKYWCRLHQVWMSEEDVKKKRCNCRPTLDMISVQKCVNLEEKNYEAWKNSLSVPKER